MQEKCLCMNISLKWIPSGSLWGRREVSEVVRSESGWFFFTVSKKDRSFNSLSQADFRAGSTQLEEKQLDSEVEELGSSVNEYVKLMKWKTSIFVVPQCNNFDTIKNATTYFECFDRFWGHLQKTFNIFFDVFVMEKMLTFLMENKVRQALDYDFSIHFYI